MWLIQAMAVGSHGIIIFMILAFTKVRSPSTLVVMISGLGPKKGLIHDGFVLQETFWFWVDLIKNWRTPMLVRLFNDLHVLLQPSFSTHHWPHAQVLDGTISRTQTNSTAQSTSRKSAESAEDSIM